MHFSRQLAVAAEEYDFMVLFKRNLEILTF